MGEKGLENFNKYFSPDFEGNLPNDEDRARKMDEASAGIEKATEAIQAKNLSQAERAKEVNEAMVHTFLSAADHMPDDIRERMLKAMDTPENQATIKEIRRRLDNDD